MDGSQRRSVNVSKGGSLSASFGKLPPAPAPPSGDDGDAPPSTPLPVPGGRPVSPRDYEAQKTKPLPVSPREQDASGNLSPRKPLPQIPPKPTPQIPPKPTMNRGGDGVVARRPAVAPRARQAAGVSAEQKTMWTRSREIPPEIAQELGLSTSPPPASTKPSSPLSSRNGDSSDVTGDSASTTSAVSSVTIKTEWQHTTGKSKVAKKIEREAQKLQREKEIGGQEALQVQEENQRLATWVKMLEKQQKENQAYINKLQADISHAKKSSANFESKYHDLRRRLFEAETLLEKAKDVYETVDRSEPTEEPIPEAKSEMSEF